MLLAANQSFSIHIHFLPNCSHLNSVSPTSLEGNDEPQQYGARIYSQPNITFDPDSGQVEFDNPNKSNEMLPER